GSFWAPDPTVPLATGVQIPLFMFLGLTEAVGLGLAVSLLLYGSAVLRDAPVSPGLARATQWSIAWFLGNWWAHDSLHLHNGLNLRGLLGIEYGFHVTLLIAGLVIAQFFIKAAQAQAAAVSSVMRQARVA